MENPLVSVIIPTYNREKYLNVAINSIIERTYENLEIIIINDGSIDNTEKIVGDFFGKDKRINYIKNEKNLGLVKSLNKASKIAKGKYIARLDDDDKWIDKNKIKKQVDFLENHNNYALVGGGMIKVDKRGKEIMKCIFPEQDEEIRKVILIGNPFVHSSVFFRKDIFEEVGRYDEEFDFMEDMDLWLKIGLENKMYNFQDYFVSYLDKEYDGNYSIRHKMIRRKLSLNIRLRKKFRNDYPNFWVGILICCLNYVYSFFPFGEKLKLFFLRIKKILFLPIQYKYLKS